MAVGAIFAILSQFFFARNNFDFPLDHHLLHAECSWNIKFILLYEIRDVKFGQFLAFELHQAAKIDGATGRFVLVVKQRKQYWLNKQCCSSCVQYVMEVFRDPSRVSRDFFS